MAILGVQEHDGLAVGADLGDWVEGLDALGHEVVDGLGDIVDLDADVVDASGLVLVQESLDGRVLAIGVQQLDLGVAELDKDGVDTVLGQGLEGERECVCVGLDERKCKEKSAKKKNW